MDLQSFVKYRNMGGWLRLFQVLSIISVVVSGLSVISLLATSHMTVMMGAITQAYLLYTIVIAAVGLVFTVITLVMLGKRNKTFVAVFAVNQLLGLVFSVVSMFIPMMDTVRLANYARSYGLDPDALLSLYSTSNATTMFSVILGLVYSVAWLVAWLVYFKKSNRTRVYLLTNQQFNEEYIARRQEWERQQPYPMAGGVPVYPAGASAPGMQPPAAPGQAQWPQNNAPPQEGGPTIP